MAANLLLMGCGPVAGGTSPPPPTVYAQDAFPSADSTTLNGSALQIGGTWAVHTMTPDGPDSPNTLQINAHQVTAVVPSKHAVASTTLNHTDYTINMVLSNDGSATTSVGVAVRILDVDNYWLVNAQLHNNADSFVQLFEVAGGAFNQIADQSVDGTAGSHTVMVSTLGSQLSASFDGVLCIVNGSVSTHTGSTLAGFMDYDFAGSGFGNASITFFKAVP